MRLWDYIEQGGSIMYILLFANILGLSLLVWRLVSILEAKKKAEDLAKLIIADFTQSMGHSLAELATSSTSLSLLKDMVASRVHRLQFGLNTIKIIASVAPLLGLLGTVIGILSAFQVIASKGLSDPSLFAGGISMALITTVGGLIVAIPHFVGHNYLVGLLDELEINLENRVVEKIYGKK